MYSNVTPTPLSPEVCNNIYQAVISNKIKSLDDMERLPLTTQVFLYAKLPDEITFNNVVGACWRTSDTPQIKGLFKRQWITSQVRKSVVKNEIYRNN